MKEIILSALLLVVGRNFIFAEYPQPCEELREYYYNILHITYLQLHIWIFSYICFYGDIIDPVASADPFEDRRTDVDLPLRRR